MINFDVEVSYTNQGQIYTLNFVVITLLDIHLSYLLQTYIFITCDEPKEKRYVSRSLISLISTS